MPHKPSALVADCHHRAADCRENAKCTTNAIDREFFGEMERRWLFLANSYAFTERLASMSDEIDRPRNEGN